MEGGRGGEGADECHSNGRPRASEGVDGLGGEAGERWQTLLTALNGRPGT